MANTKNKTKNLNLKSKIQPSETDGTPKFSKICRVCLCKTKDSGRAYKLKTTIIFFNESHEIKKMLEESTGLQIDNLDTLPYHLCSRCLNHLKSWYKFRYQCKIADDIFQKFNTTSKDTGSFLIKDSFHAKDFQVVVVKEKSGEIGFVLHCNCCEMLFKNLLDFDQHQQTTNISDCKDCGKSFKNRYAYQNHKSTPCVPLALIEKCKIPSSNTSFEEMKAAGERVIKATKVSCVFCKKNFKNRDKLRPHVVEKHKNNVKCDICNKRFKRVQILEEHMRMHLGEKMYSCPICSRSYHSLTQFRVHIVEHSTKEMVYRCNVCEKEFLYEYAFIPHMKQHLEEEQYNKRLIEFEKEEVDALITENDANTVLKNTIDNGNKLNTAKKDDSENVPYIKIETDFEGYLSSKYGQEEAYKMLTAETDSEVSVPIKIEIDCLIDDTKEQLQEIKLEDPIRSVSSMKICFQLDHNNTNTLDKVQSHKTDNSDSINAAEEFIKTELVISADEESFNDTEDVSMFSEEKLLKQHQLQNYRKILNECKLTCHVEGCKTEHKQFMEMWKHFSKEHLSINPPFKCSVCLEEFQNKRVLLPHIKKHYFYKCSVCSKLKKYPKDLRNHIIQVHINKKVFKCPNCCKHMKSKIHLQNHYPICRIRNVLHTV